jgi:fumarylacetoacetate (FAA) hydrolase
MKLGSLRSGRDGKLVVVSDDLRWCVDASAVAPTLQAALDNWPAAEPPADIALRFATGDGSAQPFREAEAASPLPRAHQWADGSAYVNHVELVRRARGATMPDSFWTDPLMYRGASDGFLGPHEPIPLGDEAWGGGFRGRDRRDCG